MGQYHVKNLNQLSLGLPTSFFFTPIPRTFTSSPLDGMAKNQFFYMDTQDHAIYHVWIHFIPTSLYPRREKTIWSELQSNPGPLDSQATALTTRPWLLGQQISVNVLHKWDSKKVTLPMNRSADAREFPLRAHRVHCGPQIPARARQPGTHQ